MFSSRFLMLIPVIRRGLPETHLLMDCSFREYAQLGFIVVRYVRCGLLNQLMSHSIHLPQRLKRLVSALVCAADLKPRREVPHGAEQQQLLGGQCV